MKRILMVAVVWAGLFGMACGVQNVDEEDPVVAKDAMLRVMLDAQASSQVAGVYLGVYPCDGEDALYSHQAELADWNQHSMMPSYISGPDHLFLEHRMEVQAGCYDVEASLLGDDGMPLAQCSVALGKNIDVGADEVAEVILFSHCRDQFNYVPRDEHPLVEMIRFFPSPLLTCEESALVCATVNSGGKEVQLSWNQVGGKPLLQAPTIDEMSVDGDRVVQCARWSPYYKGETIVEVTASTQSKAAGDSAFFSLYMECPGRKDVVSPLPPSGDHKSKKYPRKPKDPKDDKDKGEGELEVIVALNHPPRFVDMDYNPAKFVGCPPQVTLCATATDDDGDPLSFEWEQVGGPPVLVGPTVSSFSEEEGTATECVDYVFEKSQQEYAFKITVFDLFHDGQELITAEEWFEQNGYGHVESRAELTVPVYVSCDKEAKKAE